MIIAVAGNDEHLTDVMLEVLVEEHDFHRVDRLEQIEPVGNYCLPAGTDKEAADLERLVDAKIWDVTADGFVAHLSLETIRSAAHAIIARRLNSYG